jgi:hypothetical protein
MLAELKHASLALSVCASKYLLVARPAYASQITDADASQITE